MATPIRVLYIDDDPALGRLMQRALAPAGMEIECARSGAEGLSRLQIGGSDIVALDHDLAGESGLDVLARIRSRPDPPPVIYVTGSDDARVAVAALKAGAVDYVWKDVQGHYRDLLVESIRAALQQEETRQHKERAEREVREGKERAELLLREVNHRVANSLALVSSLAGLQAKAVSDEGAKVALRDMQARIAAIAGVHRSLYTSADVRSVAMDIYLRHLVDELSTAMADQANPHRLALDIDGDLQIATDKAVSVGVVVSELVTNAYKYAYPAGVAGDIRVRLRRRDAGHLVLAVEDDGVGWAGFGDVQGTGLGRRIIGAMAASLRSSLDYDRSHRGTRVVIDFAG